MPKYAIIDTETSGLFKFKDPVTGAPIPADDPSQPRLAELGYILLDDDLNEVEAESIYVRPDGWEMEAGASEANGLTTAFLAENGVPVVDVLATYTSIVREGYIICAYNAQFDTKQMRGELRRAGMPDLFDETPNICLMRSAMKLGVEKPDGKKGFPKLEHCAAHLGIEHEGKHTAMGDCRVKLALFRELHARGLLIEPAVHYAKVAPTEAAGRQTVEAPPMAPTEVEAIPAAVPERF